MKKVNKKDEYVCEFCGEEFRYKYNHLKHLKTKHKGLKGGKLKWIKDFA